MRADLIARLHRADFMDSLTMRSIANGSHSRSGLAGPATPSRLDLDPELFGGLATVPPNTVVQ